MTVLRFLGVMLIGALPRTVAADGGRSAGDARSVAEGDDMSVLHVHLTPPPHPLPEIVAEIRALDDAHEMQMALGRKALHDAYDQALRYAKKMVSAMVVHGNQLDGAAKAAAFVGKGGLQASIKVNVMPPVKPDAAVIQRIRAVDAKLSREDALMIQQGVDELIALARLMPEELAARIGASSLVAKLDSHTLGVQLRGASVVSLPPERDLDVRLSASTEMYPTTVGLVQDMVRRRHVARRTTGNLITELLSKLLSVQLQMVKEEVAQD